jgi:chemotaxis protein methyltransferase CheR
MNPGDLNSLMRLVQELCGLALDADKAYLVESRLTPLAAKSGCGDLGSLVKAALLPGNARLREQIVDVMTTHETSFFRDASPFEALQYKALPEILDRQAHSASGPRLRLWSAACSSGQEVYSLAITVLETLGEASGIDVQILGTDVSIESVEQARQGVYTQMAVDRGLSPERRARWFERVADGWRAVEPLRRIVRFEQRNLLAPFPERDFFHVVFCRNVAIYFSAADRKSLFERLVGTMTPQGLLFVGSSENLSDLGPKFLPEIHCRSVFYRPRRDPAGLATLAAEGTRRL